MVIVIAVVATAVLLLLVVVVGGQMVVMVTVVCRRKIKEPVYMDDDTDRGVSVRMTLVITSQCRNAPPTNPLRTRLPREITLTYDCI